MEVEEIEVDVAPGKEATGARIGLTKKTLKDTPSSSSTNVRTTLTRFLGPSGPPLAQWEDINRECPVCHRKGFSSRALVQHVNECLDMGLSKQDDDEACVREHAKTGTSNEVSVENAGAKSKPIDDYSSYRSGSQKAAKAAKVAKRPSATARRTDREGIESEANATSKSTDATSASLKVCSDDPSMKEKAQIIQKAGHSVRTRDSVTPEPGVSWIDRKNTRKAKAKAISNAHAPSPSKPASNPTIVRSRSDRTVASRPRRHKAATGATPMPAAIGEKRGEERLRADIALTQLMFVLGEGARCAGINGGCIGTRLFPSPTREDVVVEGDEFAPWESHTGNTAAIKATTQVKDCPKRGRNRRVRPRPASWDARPCDEEMGWLGPLPHNDCWGDGDGYLTVRPFPASEDFSDSDATIEEEEENQAINGNRGESSDLKDNMINVTPSSRADRFLEVFVCLQPARRSLQLGEALPALSRPVEFSEIPRKCPPPSDADTHERENATVDAEIPIPKIEPKPKPNATESMGCKHECIPRHVDAKNTTTPEMERPRIAVHTQIAKAADHGQKVNDQGQEANGQGQEANEQVERLSRSLENGRLKIRHAFGSPQSGETSFKKVLVPFPLEISSQLHSPKKTSSEQSEQYRVGKRSRTSSQAIDLTSEASPPRMLGAGGGGVPVGRYPRRDDRDSLGADKTWVKRDTLPKRVCVGEESEAEEPGIARFSSPARGAINTSVPRHINSVPRYAWTALASDDASPPAAVQLPPPTSGSMQLSPLQKDRNAAIAREFRSTVYQRSVRARVSPTDVENTSTDSLGREKLDGCTMAQPGVDCEKLVLVPSKANSAIKRSKLPRALTLTSRASSGVVRSAGVAEDPKGSGNLDSRGTPKTASARFTCADSVLDKFSPVDAVTDTAFQAHGGHLADVPQKGSLTVVDPDHGATLRSSWSIDHSERLGKLEFGATLGYDAVWYHPPADEDCVAVLRYHIVPHSVLAPSGGWISERGRFRDDPYIIVKATPASRLSLTAALGRDEGGRTASSQCPSDPYRQREDLSLVAPVTLGYRSGEVLVRSSLTLQGNDEQQQAHSRTTEATVLRKPFLSADGNRHLILASTSPGVVAQSRKLDAPSLPAERARRQQNNPSARPGSETVGGDPSKSVPATGRFGLTTSPSPKALEANDTGHRVKCPVCNRGMDHWPQAQRNQHAHNCMLKNSSLTKNQNQSPTLATLATTRIQGHQGHRGDNKQARGAAQEVEPSRSRASKLGRTVERVASRLERGSGSADMEVGPRQRRVSLEGLFSPKPKACDLVRADGDDAGSRAQQGNISRRGPYSTFELDASTSRSATSSTTTTLKQGASGAKRNHASEVRSECPICRLSFAGRQGHWERDAHIQQCLESLTLEGAFDSHE